VASRAAPLVVLRRLCPPWYCQHGRAPCGCSLAVLQSVRSLVWPLKVGGFFQLHRHQLAWASEETHLQTKHQWPFHMVVLLVELPSLPQLTTVACHLLQSPPWSWCMLELPSWHWLLSICLLPVACRWLQPPLPLPSVMLHGTPPCTCSLAMLQSVHSLVWLQAAGDGAKLHHHLAGAFVATHLQKR